MYVRANAGPQRPGEGRGVGGAGEVALEKTPAWVEELAARYAEEAVRQGLEDYYRIVGEGPLGGRSVEEGSSESQRALKE